MRGRASRLFGRGRSRPRGGRLGIVDEIRRDGGEPFRGELTLSTRFTGRECVRYAGWAKNPFGRSVDAVQDRDRADMG